MDKSLATLPEGKGTDLANLNMQQIIYVGDLMHKAGMFTDIQSAAAATVKVMAGQELGLTPFQAMNSFHIIKGRATMAANLMAAKIKQSGRYDYRITVNTDELNVIDVYVIENGKRTKIAEERFSAEDAQKAGTQNMSRFPRNMLFARNISNVAKWHCPDVFGAPVYVDEDFNDHGQLIDETDDHEIREAEEVKATQEADKKAKREHAAAAGSRTGVKAKAPEPEITDEAPTDAEVDNLDTDLDRAFAEAEAEKVEPAEDRPYEPRQLRTIMAKLGELGFTDDADAKVIFMGLSGLESRKDMTFNQAVTLIDQLNEANAGHLRSMFLEG